MATTMEGLMTGWVKDTAAGLLLLAFVASSFVLADAARVLVTSI